MVKVSIDLANNTNSLLIYLLQGRVMFVNGELLLLSTAFYCQHSAHDAHDAHNAHNALSLYKVPSQIADIGGIITIFICVTV